MENNNRTYGVEIEAHGVGTTELANALNEAGINCNYEGYNHTTRNHWKIVRDSSIHGNKPFELVSPPLKGEEGLEEIKKVCQVLKTLGAQVNTSCGLHVHHDAGDLNLDNFKNLYSLYTRFESTIDQFVPESRRGNNNNFCKTLQGLNDQIHQSRSLEEIKTATGSRYVKLNIQSYWRHGTIEFRHHPGTINPTKIINWIILTQLMVERSKSTVRVTRTEVNLRQLQKVLTRNLNNNHNPLFTYFKKRAQQVAA